jgi:hypothetical protein
MEEFPNLAACSPYPNDRAENGKQAHQEKANPTMKDKSSDARRRCPNEDDGADEPLPPFRFRDRDVNFFAHSVVAEQ